MSSVVYCSCFGSGLIWFFEDGSVGRCFFDMMVDVFMGIIDGYDCCFDFDVID